MSVYPLKFRPIFVPKPWGGRRIAALRPALPNNLSVSENIRIGESWEVSDIPEGRSVVANGPLAGRTLHDVLTHFGPEFLGQRPLTERGCFPLLVKYLDAAENLSVQVHPDVAYCAKHADARLKSEAWFIMAAEPGAVIYKGIQKGVTRDQFRRHIAEGRVVDDLIAVPARVGDCHYLPSGTCHALGAGVMVLEVQTPSDTTFRVYDWGRTDRELHIDQAMECIHFGPPDTGRAERRSHVAGFFVAASRLCTCEHFQIERVRMVAEYGQVFSYDRPAVWVVLSGRGVISGVPAGIETQVEAGEVILVPAGMSGARVDIIDDMEWLDVQLPRISSDLLAQYPG